MSNAANDRRQSWIRFAASALIAAAFLWWFFRGLSPAAIAAEIRQADVRYVVAAAAVSLGGFGIRIWRWRYLVAPLKWTRLQSLASATFIGWAITAMLPGRLGEPARALVLARREGVRTSAAFGTIVLERLLDTLAILLLLAAALILAPATSLGTEQTALMVAIRTGASIAFAVLIAIGILIFASRRLPERMVAAARMWMNRLPGAIGRVGWNLTESFGAGLSGVLGNAAHEVPPARLRTVIGVHTAMMWALVCSVHALLLKAFGIEASWLNIPPLLFLITLGLSVPIPAALGSYHKAVQLGLTVMLGVPADTAAGYAIVSHAVTLIPPVLIGVMLLVREGPAASGVFSATRSPAGLRSRPD